MGNKKLEKEDFEVENPLVCPKMLNETAFENDHKKFSLSPF